MGIEAGGKRWAWCKHTQDSEHYGHEQLVELDVDSPRDLQSMINVVRVVYRAYASAINGSGNQSQAWLF